MPSQERQKKKRKRGRNYTKSPTTLIQASKRALSFPHSLFTSPPFPLSTPLPSITYLLALDLVHGVLAEQEGGVGVPVLVVGVAEGRLRVHRLPREELELFHLPEKKLDGVLGFRFKLGGLVLGELLDDAGQPRLDVAHEGLLVVGGLLDQAERLDDVDDLAGTRVVGGLLAVGPFG